MRRVNFTVLLVLVLLVCLLNNAFPQENPLFLPHGNTLENLNGLGYSGANNNISNLTSINPAALANFTNFSAGLSYQFATTIDNAWLADIGYKKNKNGIPQGVGIIFPYKNFRFAAGFSQRFNATLDFGILPVTDIEHPDGTGEYFAPYDYYNLMSYSAAIAYSTNTEKNNLSFGMRWNYDRLNVYEKRFKGETSYENEGFSFAAGVMYQTEKEDFEGYKLHLFYEQGTDISGMDTYTFNDTYAIPDSLTGNISHGNYSGTYRYYYNAKMRDKLNMGVDIPLVNSIKLSAGATLFFPLKERSEKYESDYSVSVIKKFSEKITGSAGFFASFPNRLSDGLEDENDNLKVLFFTVGANIKLLPNFSIDIALADSHLFSNKWRRQTIGKIGVIYMLN